jgi:hypothetical protein
MGSASYTGIGARETPVPVLKLALEIGRFYSARDVTLRSGGSPGADTAFEEGCSSGPKEIYLPWQGFNGRSSPLALTDEFLKRITAHEAWRVLRDALQHESPPIDLDALPQEEQLLSYARDVPEILGASLDAPSTRVVCWTPPSGEAEGTRIALYVAQHWRIPVDNLNDPTTVQYWRDAIAGG